MPSAYSNIVAVTMHDVPTTPVLSASVAGADISLSWTASTVGDSTISAYLLYRSTDGTDYSLYQTLGGDVLSYDDDGLEVPQEYWYYVVAQAATEVESADSNVVSETTSAVYDVEVTFGSGEFSNPYFCSDENLGFLAGSATGNDLPIGTVCYLAQTPDGLQLTLNIGPVDPAGPPQDLFDSMTFTGASGQLVLNSADATFTTASSVYGQWVWNLSESEVSVDDEYTFAFAVS